MKITSLSFEKYNQFENLTIDLTYPAGHPKAGQPLDKVCLIGQNGTGKTTILEVISGLLTKFGYEDERIYQAKVLDEISQKVIGVHYEEKFENGNVWNISFDNKRYNERNAFLLYLKADILSNIQYLIKEKDEKKIIGTYHIKNSVSMANITGKVIQIDNLTPSNYWLSFFSDFENFDNNILEKTKNLLSAATTKNGEKLLHDFIQWKTTQKNPREIFAKHLNPFLERFGLEMDIDNTDVYISLRSLDKSVELQPQQLSTGILQIILTSVPIFALANKVEIVLIDEPERSLYPDTQRDITELYTGMSPESQFFFATHSPIIAASFEPWEIVELYFDEQHQVRQRLYYNGERHVDNYKIHPKYMRWDSLLIQLFGIDKEGNPARETELQRFFEIKTLMDTLKANGGKGIPEMLALWQQYQKAAENLDWRTDNYKNGTAA